ncbi:hypothetical protein JCM8097_009580 [Rhodosporidiobolus ruineniae]
MQSRGTHLVVYPLVSPSLFPADFCVPPKPNDASLPYFPPRTRVSTLLLPLPRNETRCPDPDMPYELWNDWSQVHPLGKNVWVGDEETCYEAAERVLVLAHQMVVELGGKDNVPLGPLFHGLDALESYARAVQLAKDSFAHPTPSHLWDPLEPPTSSHHLGTFGPYNAPPGTVVVTPLTSPRPPTSASPPRRRYPRSACSSASAGYPYGRGVHILADVPATESLMAAGRPVFLPSTSSRSFLLSSHLSTLALGVTLVLALLIAHSILRQCHKKRGAVGESDKWWDLAVGKADEGTGGGGDESGKGFNGVLRVTFAVFVVLIQASKVGVQIFVSDSSDSSPSLFTFLILLLAHSLSDLVLLALTVELLRASSKSQVQVRQILIGVIVATVGAFGAQAAALVLIQFFAGTLPPMAVRLMGLGGSLAIWISIAVFTVLLLTRLHAHSTSSRSPKSRSSSSRLAAAVLFPLVALLIPCALSWLLLPEPAARAKSGWLWWLILPAGNLAAPTLLTLRLLGLVPPRPSSSSSFPPARPVLPLTASPAALSTPGTLLPLETHGGSTDSHTALLLTARDPPPTLPRLSQLGSAGGSYIGPRRVKPPGAGESQGEGAVEALRSPDERGAAAAAAGGGEGGAEEPPSRWSTETGSKRGSSPGESRSSSRAGGKRSRSRSESKLRGARSADQAGGGGGGGREEKKHGALRRFFQPSGGAGPSVKELVDARRREVNLQRVRAGTVPPSDGEAGAGWTLPSQRVAEGAEQARQDEEEYAAYVAARAGGAVGVALGTPMPTGFFASAGAGRAQAPPGGVVTFGSLPLPHQLQPSNVPNTPSPLGPGFGTFVPVPQRLQFASPPPQAPLPAPPTAPSRRRSGLDLQRSTSHPPPPPPPQLYPPSATRRRTSSLSLASAASASIYSSATRYALSRSGSGATLTNASGGRSGSGAGRGGEQVEPVPGEVVFPPPGGYSPRDVAPRAIGQASPGFLPYLLETPPGSGRG